MLMPVEIWQSTGDFYAHQYVETHLLLFKSYNTHYFGLEVTIVASYDLMIQIWEDGLR